MCVCLLQWPHRRCRLCRNVSRCAFAAFAWKARQRNARAHDPRGSTDKDQPQELNPRALWGRVGEWAEEVQRSWPQCPPCHYLWWWRWWCCRCWTTTSARCGSSSRSGSLQTEPTVKIISAAEDRIATRSARHQHPVPDRVRRPRTVSTNIRRRPSATDLPSVRSTGNGYQRRLPSPADRLSV